jgi:Rrf2 family iron-sulfur cluster assembly transcriptional regulator
MLSNRCRYGIRAVIYLAFHYPDKTNIGIKKISDDLKLPSPFLAKILQQLAKQKVLNSTKGPNGGFSLLKKPESITLLDIVKIIDGEAILKNCIIHDGSCAEIRRNKKICPVHDDYSVIRANIISLFRNRTIADLVKAARESKNISI